MGDKQLEQIRKDIEALITQDDNLSKKQEIITSYKGVGKKIARVLLIELPELGKLSNKEISSLVGLAPKTVESGKKVYKAHITGGRFVVRQALYMAALVATRYNKIMQGFYNKLLNAGKAPKIALVAVMRKIIVCLNSMLKHNTFLLDS
ncbi:transposase [Candidatus Tisiphia endosymbiont of Nemotelus uliginosus]|uniref:transposase n=1 Tax=Candidatus Tisiphia endosymbiont of Nemotelus uliginosus TaxID=3077926 RepID=UPI0035C8B98E